MPINFKTISTLCQNSIAEKIDFDDFARFEIASKHSRNVSNEIWNPVTITKSKETNGTLELGEDGKLILQINQEPIGITIQLSEDYKIRFDMKLTLQNATEELCKAARCFMLKTGSTAISTTFQETISCSQETLNQLLDTSGTTKFIFEGPQLSIDYLRIPAMKKMKCIKVDVNGVLSGEDFLSLTAGRISLLEVNIDQSTFNQLIKEHMTGTRNIRKIEIGFPNQFRAAVFAAVACKSNFSLIPEDNEENNDEMEYSLIYSRDGRKQLKVLSFGDRIVVCSKEVPFDPMIDYLLNKEEVDY